MSKVEELKNRLFSIIGICYEQDCLRCFNIMNTTEELIKEASKEFNEV